ADYVSLNNDTTLVNSPRCFLLLKSKKGVSKHPQFEKISEREIRLEDTVHLDLPDDKPVYMTVDISYNLIGKFKSMFYQPPTLSISLFLNNEHTFVLNRKIVRPIITEPVLISNVIVDNTDFKSFMTGNSNENVRVAAIALHANGRGCMEKIKLTFYKFANY
ncbi:MAG: hypothetical protein JWQ38_2789, partial [Flavipsychrobacter sp.]|nr:hypothetical protein [Flavipsychrobacter sp.]